MKIDSTSTATFIRRLNRFSIEAHYRGRKVVCHLPNPGRLSNLLVPGNRILLRKVEVEGRKTKYDVVAVFAQNRLIPIDSRLANRLVLEAVEKRGLEEFSQYNIFHSEYRYGSSRFDLMLSNRYERCLVEVKSCTLFQGDRALFPDAPTSRGVRHLVELTEALKDFHRVCIVFVVKASDISHLTPNDRTDPLFGRALGNAAKMGVETIAYSTNISWPPLEIEIAKRIPVSL